MRFETHSSFVSVPRIVAKNQIWCKTANHEAPPCDVDKIKAHVEECRQSKKLDPVVYISLQGTFTVIQKYFLSLPFKWVSIYLLIKSIQGISCVSNGSN